MAATPLALVGDPLHVRAVKQRGATTRETAWAIAERWGETEWFDAAYQAALVERVSALAREAGREFAVGPAGFGRLAQ